jgi:uncharacterized protein
MTAMFVNLPVTDLERAKAFYSAVGFTINPLFTDHNAACVVVEEDHNYFMIVTREFFSTFSDRPVGAPSKTVSASTSIMLASRDFFQSFTDLPVGEPTKNVSASTSVMLDSREIVDATVADGLAAGGTETKEPADYGFMYQRQLTDPDGNILEFGWMDPVAATQGPEAFADQQA